MKKIALIAVLSVLALVSCDETVVLGDADDGEIVYKSGELTFVDEHTDEIYSDKYSRDYYDMYAQMTVTSDAIVYGNYEPRLLSDDGSLLEFCRDPLCDHSKPQSCVLSYGGVRRVICTDDYIYFAKATGVYRYDLRTLTSEPYALFNAYVSSQFLMGRYLYIDLGAGDFVKVNTETDEATVISDIPLADAFIRPHEGDIYLLDSASGVHRCDENFENIEHLVGKRTFECDLQDSYQISGDHLYYLDGDVLYRMNLTERASESFIDNVCAFSVAGDEVYYMRKDPMPGPEYDNGSEIVTTELRVGKKIYVSPLDSPENRRVFWENDLPDTRLDSYFLHATENYLYFSISEFTDRKLEAPLFRLSLSDRVLERFTDE